MDDKERDKPSPPSSGSSSASASQSRDARSSVSGHDLLVALEGLERDLRGIDRRLESVERAVTSTGTRLGFVAKQQELDGRRIAAMRIESAAALSRVESATKALATGQQTLEGAAKRLDETGKHLIPREEFDRFEITAKGFRLSATWLRIGAAVKAVPLVVKFALVALGSAAAAAAYVWKAFHH